MRKSTFFNFLNPLLAKLHSSSKV